MRTCWLRFLALALRFEAATAAFLADPLPGCTSYDTQSWTVTDITGAAYFWSPVANVIDNTESEYRITENIVDWKSTMTLVVDTHSTYEWSTQSMQLSVRFYGAAYADKIVWYLSDDGVQWIEIDSMVPTWTENTLVHLPTIAHARRHLKIWIDRGADDGALVATWGLREIGLADCAAVTTTSTTTLTTSSSTLTTVTRTHTTHTGPTETFTTSTDTTTTATLTTSTTGTSTGTTVTSVTETSTRTITITETSTVTVTTTETSTMTTSTTETSTMTSSTTVTSTGSTVTETATKTYTVTRSTTSTSVTTSRSTTQSLSSTTQSASSLSTTSLTTTTALTSTTTSTFVPTAVERTTAVAPRQGNGGSAHSTSLFPATSSPVSWGSTTSTDASTSPTANTTTSRTGTTATGTATSTTGTGRVPEAKLAEQAVEAVAKRGVELLRRSGLPNISQDTEIGEIFIYELDKVEKPNETSLNLGEGSQVLPEPLLKEEEHQMLVGVQISFGESSPWPRKFDNPFAKLKGARGEPLATPVLEMSVYDDFGAKVAVRGLDPPLLFRLTEVRPDKPIDCVFLDTEGVGGPRWSTAGVWTATDEEVRRAGYDPKGVWCFTRHLSLFAAILQLVLGCTNLELISEEGLKAITANEDWWQSNAAVLVFIIAAMLLFVVAAGILWELWVTRMGRTYDKGKAVKCCRHFLTMGPQMIKYRYAAFIVYARDLFRMLTTGREKLRITTLTSSVQRYLALRTGICVTCVSQHCWNGGGWIDTQASLPWGVVCRKLEFHAGMAEEIMRKDFDVGVGHSLRRYLFTVLALHPLLDAMRVGAGSLTVLKRTALQVCGIFGVLATNALIFNFSGSLRSWEADVECPINPRSHFFILVATLVSMVLNVVPNSFLMDIAKQVHGRPMWLASFWLMLLGYLLSSTLLVVIALANLNPKDQDKWHRSLQFSITIKLFVMPMLQGLRHTVLLEIFLYEDRQRKPSQQFPVVMGLRHPNEEPLDRNKKEEVEMMARQSISVSDLVNFFSLLGDAVMVDYNPKTSTSEDVMMEAIKPLCMKPPSLGECPIRVEVVQVSGFQMPPGTPPMQLACSVLHLGSQVKNERFCIVEQTSQECSAQADSSAMTCRWSFEASLSGVEPEHAFGFVLRSGEEKIAVACLTAEKVLRSRDWSGELALQPAERVQGSSASSYLMPAQAGAVHSWDFSATEKKAASQRACLSVKVHVPAAYLQHLALHELRKLKEMPPVHESELQTETSELQAKLIRGEMPKEMAASPGRSLSADGFSTLTSGAFCRTYLGKSLPPDRMVVHSRKGTFLHLVSSVLADALGQVEGQAEMSSRLLDRDFHGLLDMLEDAGVSDTRYWIEVFAIDPSGFQSNVLDSNGAWHEELLTGLPTIMRSLRRTSCLSSVSDIFAGKFKRRGPLKQLLIMDRNFHFLHERTCLAEMMVAKAMRVKQQLVLHPDDLHDTVLSKEIERLGKELTSAYKASEVPWTIPYLEDSDKVFETVKDLVVQGVKDHKTDVKSTWTELNLTDVAATVGALHAAHSFGPRHSGSADRQGADHNDDVNDGDADAADGGADVDV